MNALLLTSSSNKCPLFLIPGTMMESLGQRMIDHMVVEMAHKRFRLNTLSSVSPNGGPRQGEDFENEALRKFASSICFSLA